MLLGASSVDQLMENIGAIQVSRASCQVLGPRALEQSSGSHQSFVQHIFVEHLLRARHCPRYLGSIGEPPTSPALEVLACQPERTVNTKFGN